MKVKDPGAYASGFFISRTDSIIAVNSTLKPNIPARCFKVSQY